PAHVAHLARDQRVGVAQMLSIEADELVSGEPTDDQLPMQARHETRRLCAYARRATVDHGPGHYETARSEGSESNAPSRQPTAISSGGRCSPSRRETGQHVLAPRLPTRREGCARSEG